MATRLRSAGALSWEGYDGWRAEWKAYGWTDIDPGRLAVDRGISSQTSPSKCSRGWLKMTAIPLAWRYIGILSLLLAEISILGHSELAAGATKKSGRAGNWWVYKGSHSGNQNGNASFSSSLRQSTM
jgi:hypothetical protein